MLLPLIGSCGRKEEPIDVYSRLQEVNRLELAKMTVGKVGMITDSDPGEAKSWMDKANAMVDAIKIGKRIGVYSYDTYLIAYIDMSQLQPGDITVDKDSRTASIKLPPVEIMTDGRDPQLKEEHYRVTGLRSSIKPEERARLKAQMAAEVKKELANDDGYSAMLKASAEGKAIAWFTSLMENWGYDAEVSFK